MIKNTLRQYVIFVSASMVLLFVSCSIQADQDILSLFPIENYNQTTSAWINPNSPDYDKPLISDSVQTIHVQEFYKHYFGEKSPWNAGYVTTILHLTAPDDLATTEKSIINLFSNSGKTGPEINYGENYRPHTQEWLDDIANNIDVQHWNISSYQADHRAIAIDNLHARILPTEDVSMFSAKYAGEGYPFDNLQISAVWAGTPLYVITQTRDGTWSLVLTPDFIGWIKTNGIAYVSNGFVYTWNTVAKNHLAAITKTKTALLDKSTHRFLALTYIGSVFPTLAQNSSSLTLMVPVADHDGDAVIKYADVSTDAATVMPMTTTPHHFANLIESLKGRPYGWGNMYFYNDCSGELKSLYTPFGIYLMRHSSDQINSGKLVDESSASKEDRLTYLMQNGHKLTTIIYIGGHIIMYVGNGAGVNGSEAAMTYQDMWGLAPDPALDPVRRRAVVGKSVFFPLLLQFPEDKILNSQANKKYFQVSYLDQLPTPTYAKFPAANLRILMGVESS